MIFPEHMEFRYYITPERKECFTLYSKTAGAAQDDSGENAGCRAVPDRPVRYGFL